MSKPNIFRRIGMRVLLWILGDEEQSRTCELNRVLYERSADGRRLARFIHPQVDVGEHTYGLQRECFIAYHPGDHVRIGKYCMLGGNAMISGHLTIADRVVVSGGTLVAKSITAPGTYTAVYPMQPHAQWLKNAALVRHLDELMERLRSLEDEVKKARRG